MIQLSFHGAAGTVTGSKYLLDVNGKRIMVDCGMFQGKHELRERNWNRLPFDPSTVSAVILTHAHIDHIGYLPRLVKDGFNGTVFCTPPTADIARISLMDTAELQMEDAEYRNKKQKTRHAPALPLFNEEDAEDAIKLFENVNFGEWIEFSPEFKFRYHIVGHLLGAGSVEVIMNDNGREVSILFSGDIGRYGNPLVKNPKEPPQCDYLVCESTYGGRMHPAEDPYFQFDELLDRIVAEKRVLVIPAFAIGRTQQVIYLVDDLVRHKRIKPIDIHVDSPMAVSATDIYLKYHEYHAIDLDKLDQFGSVLNGKRVHLHRTRASSKKLNDLRGPAIIISSSGMLTGGRIMHHMINRLPDPGTTVALVGFMAEGTLGRKLLDGERQVYIHKIPIEVRAEIVVVSSLSGHADYHEIMHWLEPIKKAPKTTFITHGEPDQAEAMAGHIQKERGWTTLIAELDQSVEL
ncbi:MAG: MBL fold metallo-hydrolase [bacterium]|nr:MBL fold metallo-hydrolase [bacterium]